MLPIHVLNLARRPERLSALSARLDALGLGWRRAEAIDAQAADPVALRRAFGRDRAFPAAPGDMACSLGHQRLWRAIAEGPDPAALVLEDDAAPGPALLRFAAPDMAAVMARHGMGALKLEFWPGPQASRRAPLARPLGPVPGAEALGLYRLRSSFLGSCAYLLTAAAARQLLRRHPVMAVPVDHFLFGREAGRGFPLLRPGMVNPAPVLHDVTRLGSDIRAGREELGIGAPRGPRRRLRDAAVRWRQRRELARGEAERVAMALAGGPDQTIISLVAESVSAG